jgi:ubiquinone/menaquinone biosynthesis C-methylase UbiE
MMTADAQAKAAATYSAAADYYDHPANTFWERFSRRTIERLELRGGDRVLDVCCGSGASALSAAEVVGPTGLVTGIDLTEPLLNLARAKARDRGLQNVEFLVGDMMNLNQPEYHFDAVVCVFGIFFIPDMTAALRELWRRVQPGGKLAITTWGPNFFEPVTAVFWNAIREVRPDLYKDFNPWDRICDPTALMALFREAGIDEVEAVAEKGEHPIPSPDAWWAAVLGSGYRGTIDQLDADQVDHVRNVNSAFIRQNGVRSVEANVVYAIAHARGSSPTVKEGSPPVSTTTTMRSP